MIRLKLTVLMVLVLLLSVLAGNGWSVTYTWDHGGAGRLWKTAANWTSDTVPTIANDARIKDTGSDKPVIDSTHTGVNAAICSNLQIGYNAGETGEVSMTGGELICNTKLLCGYNGAGTFTMSGGSIAVTTYDVDIGAAASGTGSTFNISGGTVNPARYFRLAHLSPGALNMTGGLIKATGGNTIIGQASFGKGIINISAGTIDATGQLIRVGYNTHAIIHMTGGQIEAGDLHIPYSDSYSGYGDVNLYGGTIHTADFWMGSNGNMDIQAGTLIIDGDVTLTINPYILSGKIKGYGGDGAVNVSYDTPNAGKTTVTAISQQAYNPSPANGATDVLRTADLSWVARVGASTHDVYFGTVFADVNSADTSSSVFKCNQAGTTYDPGTMDSKTIYYWRIDEVGGSTVKGNVWNFKTESPPPKVTNPSPANSSTGIGRTVDLSWTASSTAASYNVYLGTVFANVNTATTSSSVFKGNQTGTTYDTGTMDVNITYYWRIDPENTIGVTKGDVWNFKTIAGNAGNLTLENSAYKVVQDSNLVISVTNKGSNTTLQFIPKFTVIYNPAQPTLSSTSDMVAEWAGTGQNLYATGTNTTLNATKAEIIDGKLVWTYTAQPDFDLSASLDLSTEFNEPALRYTLKAKNAGWFMLGYTGAPETNPNTMEKFHQPTMWGDSVVKPPDCSAPVFPTIPKFCQEFLCPLPAVMTRDVNGVDCAVVVSPDYQSFRLPHYKNVEFGLCIRNLDGKAQPMIFSPEMGAQEANLPTDKDSYLAVDETHCFGVLWVVDNSSWSDFYRGIVKNIFKFRDQRDNSGPGSLNELLANITDYAMDADGNNYNMWDSNQKCNEYFIDQPYSFKILGGLFAINSAIVLDNNEMFWSRSLPQVEYCISREEQYFHPYDYPYNTQMTYNNNMNGPWMSGIDLGTLYRLTGGRTTAFKTYSIEKGHTNQKNVFYQSLEWYRLYGDPSELSYAITGAYYSMNTSHYHVADFQQFLEMYEETGDSKYLDTAKTYAYQFMSTLNTSPRVPDDNYLVDENNEAPIHFQTPGRHAAWGYPPPQHMYAPQQSVPSWRVALTGMQPETWRAFTFEEYPGRLMRLSRYANDDFMRAMARWAIVGRWANYPSQMFTRNYSLVYEQDDFCMHPLEYMTFSSMHMWHHWMYIPWTIDFMVNDTIVKSDGNIDFPSRRVFDGGAGGRFNIWGDRPGTFYGDENVNLWIPNNLLTLSSQQINYIAGYGNGKLYLALSNQSASPLNNMSLTVSSSRVSYGASRNVKVWENNVAKPDKTLVNGTMNVDVPARGLTALIIEDVDAIIGKVHTNLFDKPAYALTDKSLIRDLTTESFGRMVGMIISFGPELTEAYTYTDAKRPLYQPSLAGKGGNVTQVTMYYSIDGGSWQSTPTDTVFPYEFSVKISPDSNTFAYKYEVRNDSNQLTTSSTYTLIVTPYQASKPSPAYQTTEISTTADLSWKAGYYAASHNVYFGTSQDAVTTATTASSVYKGNRTSKTYDPGTLNEGVTYYWRVDEVNGVNIWPGQVWSFTTHLTYGDFNHDGKVDIEDLATLTLHWLEDGHVGQNCPQQPTGDFNGDCRVNFSDFAIMALDWL